MKCRGDRYAKGMSHPSFFVFVLTLSFCAHAADVNSILEIIIEALDRVLRSQHAHDFSYLKVVSTTHT